MSSLKETMQTFAVNQALKYIEGNPDENLPKLMEMVDKFSSMTGMWSSARLSAPPSPKRTTGTSWF